MSEGLQRIPITKLKPGQYVVDISQQLGHIKVASSGRVKNQHDINEMIAKGIVAVTVDLGEESQHVEEDNFAFKDTFGQVKFSVEIESAKEATHKLTEVLTDSFDKIRNNDLFDVNALHFAAMEFIASIYRNMAPALAIVRTTYYPDFQVGHALRCAAYFGAMLRKMKWSPQEAQNWVMGALLHDIGKLSMDAGIQNPNNKDITPKQRAENEFVVTEHVKRGVEMATTVGSLTKETIEVIEMHHERLDGSGYPNGAKLTDLNDAMRIFCIVNEFDGLTRVASGGKPLGVLQAYRKLMKLEKEFDNDMLQRFIHNIGVYPPGTLVLLKSGKVGLVLDNSGNHLRPNIKLIYNANMAHHIKPKVYDLSVQLNEEIEGVYYGNKRGIFAENYL